MSLTKVNCVPLLIFFVPVVEPAVVGTRYWRFPEAGILIQYPRLEWLGWNESITLCIVGIADASVVLTEWRSTVGVNTARGVVGSALAHLTSEVAIPLLPVDAVFAFVLACDDFGDGIVAVEKCVVCHCFSYAAVNEIVPVPAVNEVTLKVPSVDVLKVSPVPPWIV